MKSKKTLVVFLSLVMAFAMFSLPVKTDAASDGEEPSSPLDSIVNFPLNAGGTVVANWS